MYSHFAFVFCCLILSVDLSLGISFKNFKLFHGEETREPDFSLNASTTQYTNKIAASENYIRRSDLEELANIKQRYIVKNHLDEFETQHGLHFVPNWTNVNSIKSPVEQDREIRRQRWEYIFSDAVTSVLVENLKSELRKAKITGEQFCAEIIEAYHVLSDNSYILNKEPNLYKKRKDVIDPLNQKSVQVFMKVISDSKNAKDQNEEMVQVPKSLYEELMKNRADDKLTKQHHEEEVQRVVQRLKSKHRQIIRKGKVNGKINLKFDSKMSDLS